MSSSSLSRRSGPSRNPEPRPRSRNFAPEASAMVFMCCPWGPRTFRVTLNLLSSSIPMKNWPWDLAQPAAAPRRSDCCGLAAPPVS
eukprot:CAMPEP_0198525870 /NCGR_PEP_ID=MMETSP1462-20131121/23618_1 /TAXON_ID=1333877 /ORGANISM="Brandtodinium nutriculum, Strain RCC3387" /LENGTH=85 /DNA_ID=CAMNT_0044255633 /DNA_START=428 /DNA_END=682 /DNA_ORIENTATION=+